ncbi:nicotinamide-nucleotide amidohydrolase family protein [Microbacterium chocolatum]|uniref:CinA family protein n=1 Tax=Microbacterium aurantiacum TaxID=162393 RepID=UPI00338D43DE
MTDAATLLAALRERGWTVACAESLTGGLVCAELTGVPGASATVRGGVVAYATECKVSVLGVDPALTERVGAVDPDVAGQMAEGARRLFAADVGIATTGVAGPDPQDGQPVGTVHLCVATPGGVAGLRLSLSGSRAEIRSETVRRALLLAADAVGRIAWE